MLKMFNYFPQIDRQLNSDSHSINLLQTINDSDSFYHICNHSVHVIFYDVIGIVPIAQQALPSRKYVTECKVLYLCSIHNRVHIP